VTTKVCPRCKAEKGVGEFTKDRYQKDGLKNRCAACDAKFYAENSEKLKAQNAKYRKENSEKVRARYRKYYAENTEKERVRRAKYYAENTEKEMVRRAKRYARISLNLEDSFVRYRLKNPNPPQELIELKRIQLRIHREIYKKG
jgi:hypothetical protein